MLLRLSVDFYVYFVVIDNDVCVAIAVAVNFIVIVVHVDVHNGVVSVVC